MGGKPLPNIAKLRAVEWYQTEAYCHPLTCGNSSRHELLEAKETDGGDIYLECPDCNYTQMYVPDTVYEMYLRVGVGTSFLAQ